jgi:hypothetical protein
MKTWKIGLVIICTILGIIWLQYYSKEGFQIQQMNISYPLKELYLVAPNIKVNADYVNPMRDDATKNTGYSHAEAQSACAALGATLATPEQFNKAAALGASWCVAGWTTDTAEVYIPIQKSCPKTADTTAPITVVDANTMPVVLSRGTTATIAKFPAIATTLAYPLCWGVKPAEPTVNVNQFSPTSYNMISSDLVSSVMNPGIADLFPVTFTADEANYSLEINNYNIGAPPGSNPARTYLIKNIAGSGANNPDTQIYQKDPNYAEDRAQGSVDACSILASTRRKFVDKFNQLKKVFSDVSGAVVDMLGAKNENSYFAAKLQDICSQETPESSPACMTLATLDFTLLYNTTGPNTNLLEIADGSAAESYGGAFEVVNTSTSRLAALEALNTFKFQREGELCMAYQRIQTVEQLIQCSSDSANSMGSQCAYVDVGSGLPQVPQMIGLEVNAQEFLKMRLQEISPYFATSNYASLVSGILNQLSLTLRLPSLNDFDTAKQNFQETTDRISAIRSYLTPTS